MRLDCYRNKFQGQAKSALIFLKVISEENRLKILCLLKKNEKCVCEICQSLKLPQNLVSHHLRVLKNFGLISSKREGVKIFYRVNTTSLRNNLQLINKAL